MAEMSSLTKLGTGESPCAPPQVAGGRYDLRTSFSSQRLDIGTFGDHGANPGPHEKPAHLSMRLIRVHRFIKKVQDFGIDNFRFFDRHRMRCAGNDRFATAWNGFGELIGVLALN